ncbi:MAG: CHAT domain-containing protein, partial [Cyanobacteria bacterium P01_D01_bin.36]
RTVPDPRLLGTVDIAGTASIQLGDVDASGIIEDPSVREVNINSRGGDITVGNIQAGSNDTGGLNDSGGFVDVASGGGRVVVGNINTQGPDGAGRVNVNAGTGTAIVGTVQADSLQTGGQVDIAAEGNVQVGDINAQGTALSGGQVNVFSDGDIVVDTVQTSSAQVAGDVDIASIGTVQVIEIDAQGGTAAGRVDVHSEDESVTVQNIVATSAQVGGVVDIGTPLDIQVGSIDTSGTDSGGSVAIASTSGEISADTIRTSSVQSGGQIDLVSVGDISVDVIDAQGTAVAGGAVNVVSESSVAINSLQTSSAQTGGSVDITSTSGVQLGNIDTQGDIASGRVGVNSSGDRIVIGDIQAASAQTGGVVDISSPSSIQIGNVDVQGTTVSGGTVQLAAATEGVTVGNIQAASNNQGGTINISAPDSVQVGDIDVQGTALSGGTVQLASVAEGVVAGDIQANSAQTGGTVDISALDSVQVGDIDAQGTALSGGAVQLASATETVTVGNLQVASNNQGGTVTISSPDTIQTGFIDAQGGATGGQVDITTENLFRSIASFTDDNGVDASISAAGGTDGSVIIRHDGGNQTIPFMVGDTSINGTAGAITTGANNTIPATRGFIGSYTQGDIQIITADFFEPESAEFPPPPELTELQETPFWLDEYFTRQYETYMGDGDETPVKSLDEIQQVLGEMGEATGVKPALVYVIFEPGNLVAEVEDTSNFANRGDLMRIEPTPDDSIYLVMVTPEGVPTARRVNASSATRGDASASISRFRQSLFEAREYPGEGFVPESTQQQAQDMYQWFLEPLRADMEAQGVDNLVYIMEAGLRSAPLAALSAMHDGNDYTIRDYSIGLMPSFSLTDTRYQDIRHAELRAMGASEFDSASSLPAAEVELAAVSDIWSQKQDSFGGRSHPPMQNEDFTWHNVSQQNSDQLGILHLATHANFNPTVPQDSFIRLAGDEQIPFNSIREMPLPIELLVLSACQTALEGNAHEAELGFGGLAVQTGVKSALASLWSVDDVGTFALMSAFYGYLNGNESENPIIKAEALRQAQIAMLDNQVRVEDGYLYYSETQNPFALPESFQRYLERSGNPSLNVSHPYYWAGFTMIGSPW